MFPHLVGQSGKQCSIGFQPVSGHQPASLIVFRRSGIIVREPTVVDARYRLEAYASLRRRDLTWVQGGVRRMISIPRSPIRRTKHRLLAISQRGSYIRASDLAHQARQFKSSSEKLRSPVAVEA